MTTLSAPQFQLPTKESSHGATLQYHPWNQSWHGSPPSSRQRCEGAKAPFEVPLLKRSIQMEVGIVPALVVAYPKRALIHVRSIGMIMITFMFVLRKCRR